MVEGKNKMSRVRPHQPKLEPLVANGHHHPWSRTVDLGAPMSQGAKAEETRTVGFQLMGVKEDMDHYLPAMGVLGQAGPRNPHDLRGLR
jgi:hypothetical protein